MSKLKLSNRFAKVATSAILPLVLFVLAAGVLKADTLTWTGAGNGAFWSDPANWSSDGSHTVPQSGDSVIACVDVGCNVTNDIVGLALPYLELRYKTSSSTSAARYADYYGEKITLTGGTNALKGKYVGSGYSASLDRLRCRIPFELSAGTNTFDLTSFRLHQIGVISGPGLLFVKTATYYTPQAANTYTGGTVLSGGNVDPSAPSNYASNTPYGDESKLVTVTGNTVQRIYFMPVNYNFAIENQSGRNAADMTFWLYSTKAAVFNGTITGERLCVAMEGSNSATFNNTIDISGRLLFFARTSGSTMNVVLNAHTTAASLDEGLDNQSFSGTGYTVNYTINSSNNVFGTIYVNRQNFTAGAVNAFGTNSVIRMGRLEEDRGVFDLKGFDQRIDRLALNQSYLVADASSTAHRITSTAGDACLTLAATADCETDAYFAGPISLVWSPKGNHTFQTYAACGRAMPMTGALVVSNGTFTVNGNNSFPNVPAIEVADGASFVWASGKSYGLRSAASLKIGAGATFSVSPSAALPFTTNAFNCALSLDLAEGASLSLPSGTVLPALAVTTGGVTFAVGTVLSGDVGGEGTVYLPQLGAGVKVKVVEALTPISTVSSLAYVQDGLLCHLDGIDNAGYGVHDDAAATWKDLSGVAGDFNVTANATTWTGNGLYKNGNAYMAINAAKRSDIKTIEAALSGLDRASANTVMPVYNSTDRYFIIRDSSSSRKIWRGDGNCYETALVPSEATIAVAYSSAITYQNGVVPEGASGESNTWSVNNNPLNSMSIGGRAITWGSADVSTYGYTVNALRMYNRDLTPAEIWRNYEVDSVRFRGVVPEGAVWYRVDPADAEMIDCRLDVAISGGTVSVDGGEGAATATSWPMLGDLVVLSATSDAFHDFVAWSGDTNAIVNGTVESSVVTVRVDRALSFAAMTRAGVLTVTADTCLTESVACRGIRFTGPWTLSAVEGVSLVVDEFGEGITVDEGTSDTAVISCPLTVGVISAGDEQPITVPAGATLEISGAFGGLAPLRISGAGTFKATGGGSYAGEMAVDAPKLVLAGTFASTTGAITFSTTSALELVGADVGKLLRLSRVSGVAVSCAAGTTNYLRSGWNQFTQSTTAQPYFDVLDNAELTIGGTFNGGGVGGIYPALRGSRGVVHMRTDTDKIGCLNLQVADTHVWNPMFQVTRSNYNRLNSGKSMYLHVENALTKSPWQICGYLDLCGHDQTMGRMSYVSEGSGSSWKCYTTGIIHSDAPATLTVYHDDNASGGGNHGPQVFGGTFTGAASLVKTGANGDLSMSTNHLILAGMSTSTGSVAVTWGLLSFTNAFTLGTTAYLGSWTNCTSAMASDKGVLELCHSKALGRNTDVYVGTGGKVRLSSGVRQKVRYLYLPTGANGAYERQPLGTYGSSSANGASHKLDAYFEGAGVLNCVGLYDGAIIVIR